MKKTIAISALLLAAAAAPVAAQSSAGNERVETNTNKYKVETNTFWNNWFVSVGAGAQVYFGDHDKQAEFGKRIAPAVDVAIGKWFTPGIGVRLMYSGLQVKGATQDVWSTPTHSTGEWIPGKEGYGYYLQYQKFNMFNLHADMMFNFSNLFFGYNEKRIYNCSPYIGVGWGRVWEAPKAKDVTANLGVLNSFRLCDALNLNLDLRAMLVSDRFDGEGGGRMNEGMLSATVGLTYRFKQRGWDRSKTVIVYDNDAINEMRRSLDEASAENERLKQLLAEGNRREAEQVVKHVAAGNLVTFKIGKSRLSNEARASLGMLAEVIKQGDKEAVYTVTGYADKGTGSRRFNEQLSRRRAQAVYDCLTEEFGVPASQLRMDYKGGVDNMFYDDPRLSRAVITRVQ